MNCSKRRCRTRLRLLSAAGSAAVILGVLPATGPFPARGEEIHDAIRNEDLDRVRTLLATDAARHANARARGGSTPLHWAASYSQDAAAKALIEAGADVGATTDQGSTPLHWAANKNAEGVARLLVAKGADVNARTSKGYTPLHWAAIGNAAPVAKFLIENGAEIDARKPDGATALHLAVVKNAIETI